jgi:hypothetical protein
MEIPGTEFRVSRTLVAPVESRKTSDIVIRPILLTCESCWASPADATCRQFRWASTELSKSGQVNTLVGSLVHDCGASIRSDLDLNPVQSRIRVLRAVDRPETRSRSETFQRRQRGSGRDLVLAGPDGDCRLGSLHKLNAGRSVGQDDRLGL